MNNNIFLFRFYIVFSLFFLIPLASILTVQFLDFFQLYYINLLFFLSRFDMKKIFLNRFNDIDLFNFYLISKQWFLAICLLEFSSFCKKMSENSIFSYLAFCYRKLSYYNIAEYYYLKAISLSSQDVYLLGALASMYDEMKLNDKALSLYRQIYNFDKNYLIPKFYSSLIVNYSG
uniref:Uncharacterized protein n=1 Tax=Bostrychia moritziana TaxID=103713 RepID=A0A1Z1M6S5_BOSMO|nr:hypothetical protein [Bostrychia moritziana]ARW61563.1 hypothetical protein [Bostrychia moritziana]